MKKIRFLILSALLIFTVAFTGRVVAQEKSKEEIEREMRIKEEFDAQKKAIAKQKIDQEEFLKEMQSQNEEIREAMKEAREQLEASDKYRDAMQFYYKGDPSRPLGETFDGNNFMFIPGLESFRMNHYNSDNESSSLTYSRNVKEKSFNKSFGFDVEPTVKNVVMAINGNCKAGEIRIKIVMPDNKVYSDIMIDEFGNLNWKKSFMISEEENKEKSGEWKFQINASKATGFFRISLQTY
ncbi:MAG TPA: hypothetical protein PK106_01030 [Bacteroidales bacterium]|nr:hypothetical protein [Bacteroidales bacterium]